MTQKTFSEIEETFENNLEFSYTPVVKLRPNQKTIALTTTKSGKQLTVPNGDKTLDLVDIQGNIHTWESWKYPRGTARFPWGTETHQVTLKPCPPGYGSAFVVAEIFHDIPEVAETCPFTEREVVLGCVAKKADFFKIMYEDGRIKPGCVSQISKLHDKFFAAQVEFPYGLNSFEEDLGHIEEVEETPTQDYETVIETEVIMDDLDD